MHDSATAYQDMSTMVAAKQEPLEKVEVYIARVLRLARKATASEQQILFSTITILLPHIRQHVLTQNCRSVKDIRRCSLIAETASPDTIDTASPTSSGSEIQRPLGSAVATDSYPTESGTNVHSSVLSAFCPSFLYS